MGNDVQQLLRMQDRVKKADSMVARLEGSLESAKNTLAEFGCGSVKEAKELLKQKKDEAIEKEAQLQEGTEKLKEEFDA